MDAQINITPMSEQEARECVSAIKENMESLRLMLLELHRRRGWESLGYHSWEDCATEEFGQSRSYVFKLLAAAQVEINLDSSAESPNWRLKSIPVSQLTELAKLPPEQQAEGLLKAEEIARTQGKKRPNAMHVAQAVKLVKQKSEPAPAENLDAQELAQPVSTTLKTVEQELELQAENLGLSATGNQVLPDMERNHTSPVDVDDRPFKAVLQPHPSIVSLPDIPRLQDEQLKQLIKDAKRIIRDAKLELNKRHHPEYLKSTTGD